MSIIWVVLFTNVKSRDKTRGMLNHKTYHNAKIVVKREREKQTLRENKGDACFLVKYGVFPTR